MRPLRLSLLLALATLGFASAFAAATTNAPRGKPIRPRIIPPPEANAPDPMARVVTLPGGVTITNLPPEVLPGSPTNTVRLPTWAARRFAPLGYEPTSFTVLARYFVQLPDPASDLAQDTAARWAALRSQIPDDVLALEGRKVALAGFVLPLALVDGRATQFLLLRTQSACCFGLVPRVNELVVVHVPAPGIKPRPDTPMVAAGVLHLKWIGEGGQLTALYEMQADKVEPAEP